MSTIEWVLLMTTIAGVGGTGLGGLVGAMFRKDSHRIVSLLLSFAGGVMLSIVCFDLLTEALEQGGHALATTIYGLLLGYCLIALLNYFIDYTTNKEVKHIDTSHPKTADDLGELIHADHYQVHEEEKRRGQSSYSLFIAGLVMAAAIALHNLPEGMVIGASYAGGNVSITGTGFVMAIVIGLHNIPEGMAVSVPLITGGMKRAKAILVTAITGAPTILGAILGYYLGVLSPFALTLSLSFASGAMLYVVLGELLPEAILMWRSKLPAFATMIGIILGVIIIYA